MRLLADCMLALCVVYTFSSVAADMLERKAERDALACARASIGTDSAIVECYTSRNLPIPRDL